MVTEHGTLAVQLPPDVQPGRYQVAFVIGEAVPEPERPPLELPVINAGAWPEGLSLRREDIYGDDGR